MYIWKPSYSSDLTKNLLVLLHYQIQDSKPPPPKIQIMHIIEKNGYNKFSLFKHEFWMIEL